MNKPLLIEIGCEELPADAQRPLAQALASGVKQALSEAGIEASLQAYWTPRRLIVHAPSCPEQAPKRTETIWGPPLRVAYDAAGNPTAALQGFLKRTGASERELAQAERPGKNERYLCLTRTIEGARTIDVLSSNLAEILRKLPLPKRMRWAQGKAREDEFLRPIRWIVALFGEELIPFCYAGIRAGRISFGHRVMGSKGRIDPFDPIGWLRQQGVIADCEERKALIRKQLAEAEKELGGRVVEDEALLEETAGLVEYPVAIACRFDPRFLSLPQAVIRTTLKHHQRCFVLEREGKLIAGFVAVANMRPPKPEVVREGYERVVRARLSDAMFYFERDPRISLADRVPMLQGIVYQQGLGTMLDFTKRLQAFVGEMATDAGCDRTLAERAALLCKADLTTGLVGEFPELQGEIGGIYARMQEEEEAVAEAIAEHLRPQGAEDRLPASPIARLIAIAERAERIVGAFALGREPTATRDPFGVRRAAIGLVRLLSDEDTPIQWPLARLLFTAQRWLHELAPHLAINPEHLDRAIAFVRERALSMAASLGTTRTALQAAFSASEQRSLREEIEAARLMQRFASSEEGQAAAAANKRVANILRKAGVRPDRHAQVNEALLVEEAERALWQALQQKEAQWPPKAEDQLALLASMRDAIDRFFDDVLVMAEDEALRANRLALLSRLRALFLRFGDFSLL